MTDDSYWEISLRFNYYYYIYYNIYNNNLSFSLKFKKLSSVILSFVIIRVHKC